MRQLESALKAAGDPTRTRILKLLEGRELCVCQIQAVLGLALSTISKHLAILKAAGLVEDRRDGKWIHYGLASPHENTCASGVLNLLRGALARERRILDDRRRLAEVLRLPLVTVCELASARPTADRPRASARGVSRRDRARA